MDNVRFPSFSSLLRVIGSMEMLETAKLYFVDWPTDESTEGGLQPPSCRASFQRIRYLDAFECTDNRAFIWMYAGASLGYKYCLRLGENERVPQDVEAIAQLVYGLFSKVDRNLTMRQTKIAEGACLKSLILRDFPHMGYYFSDSCLIDVRSGTMSLALTTRPVTVNARQQLGLAVQAVTIELIVYTRTLLTSPLWHEVDRILSEIQTLESIALSCEDPERVPGFPKLANSIVEQMPSIGRRVDVKFKGTP